MKQFFRCVWEKMLWIITSNIFQRLDGCVCICRQTVCTHTENIYFKNLMYVCAHTNTHTPHTHYLHLNFGNPQLFSPMKVLGKNSI